MPTQCTNCGYESNADFDICSECRAKGKAVLIDRASDEKAPQTPLESPSGYNQETRGLYLGYFIVIGVLWPFFLLFLPLDLLALYASFIVAIVIGSVAYGLGKLFMKVWNVRRPKVGARGILAYFALIAVAFVVRLLLFGLS